MKTRGNDARFKTSETGVGVWNPPRIFSKSKRLSPVSCGKSSQPVRDKMQQRFGNLIWGDRRDGRWEAGDPERPRSSVVGRL